MIEIEKEIKEQVAQGATEMDLLREWLNLYESDTIDFEELMKRVDALNREFGKAYDVSQLDSSAKDEVSLDEEAKADELFGMNENKKQEQEQEQTTMEDEEL
jgi:hypothetical protein